jgi:hypothetical protein
MRWRQLAMLGLIEFQADNAYETCIAAKKASI